MNWPLIAFLASTNWPQAYHNVKVAAEQIKKVSVKAGKKTAKATTCVAKKAVGKDCQ